MSFFLIIRLAFYNIAVFCLTMLGVFFNSNDEVGSIARIRAAEEVLAANKKLSIDFRFPLSF